MTVRNQYLHHDQTFYSENLFPTKNIQQKIFIIKQEPTCFIPYHLNFIHENIIYHLIPRHRIVRLL